MYIDRRQALSCNSSDKVAKRKVGSVEHPVEDTLVDSGQAHPLPCIHTTFPLPPALATWTYFTPPTNNEWGKQVLLFLRLQGVIEWRASQGDFHTKGDITHERGGQTKGHTHRGGGGGGDIHESKHTYFVKKKKIVEATCWKWIYDLRASFNKLVL